MMVLLRYITLLLCWSRDYLCTGPMEHTGRVAKPKQKQTGARGDCLRVVGYYRSCLCYIHSMAGWLVVGGAGHISFAYRDQFACLHVRKQFLNQHHHHLHHAADHVSMDERLPALMTGTTCHNLACSLGLFFLHDCRRGYYFPSLCTPLVFLFLFFWSDSYICKPHDCVSALHYELMMVPNPHAIHHILKIFHAHTYHSLLISSILHFHPISSRSVGTLVIPPAFVFCLFWMMSLLLRLISYGWPSTLCVGISNAGSSSTLITQ